MTRKGFYPINSQGKLKKPAKRLTTIQPIQENRTGIIKNPTNTTLNTERTNREGRQQILMNAHGKLPYSQLNKISEQKLP